MLRLFALLTIVISQLHLMRNVTPLFALLYAFSVGLTFLIAGLTGTRMDHPSRRLLGMILVLYAVPIWGVVPGLVSGAAYSTGSLALGVARLLFTIPIYVVVLWLPGTPGNLRALTMTAGVFSVLAALTIPYQFVAGPIAWFAESSERAGLFRFASLYGSLTTLGAVCGMGMVLCAYSFRSVVIATVALICIAVGAVLSLSKAALVNVALVMVVLPLVRRPSTNQFIAFIGVLVVGAWVAISWFGDKLWAVWSAFRFTDQSSGINIDDVSLWQSILDRLTALPMLAINFHGKINLVLGVGPIGGGGNFGFIQVPTVHNGLVELLLMGGIPLLLWYLLLNERIIEAGWRLARSPATRHAGIVSLFLFGSMFVNTAFGSGVLFTPAGALFFAIGIKLVSSSIPRSGDSRPSPSPYTRFAEQRLTLPSA